MAGVILKQFFGNDRYKSDLYHLLKKKQTDGDRIERINESASGSLEIGQ